MTKHDKSQGKKLRNTQIISEVMAGKTTGEVAAQVGLSRQAVSKIINHSEEAKAIREVVEKRIQNLTLKALDVVEAAMDNRDLDMNNALKASLSILDKVAARALEKREQEEAAKIIQEVAAMDAEALLENLEEAKKLIELKARKKE